MPLRRVSRCDGRSSPPTPGPSARLLQLMICRTGFALPEFRLFASSQVVLACLHTRARPRASCGWFRNPPRSLAKGTRVWFPPRVSDPPPGSMELFRRARQEGGEAHDPLATAGVSQLWSKGLNAQRRPTARGREPGALCCLVSLTALLCRTLQHPQKTRLRSPAHRTPEFAEPKVQVGDAALPGAEHTPGVPKHPCVKRCKCPLTPGRPMGATSVQIVTKAGSHVNPVKGVPRRLTQ